MALALPLEGELHKLMVEKNACGLKLLDKMTGTYEWVALKPEVLASCEVRCVACLHHLFA